MGSNSSEQSYTVSGSDLTGNITISAPSGFEVSTTSGSGFSSSLTLTQSGGTVSSTTIYVRFAPSAAQAYSGNITNSSTGATTRTVAVAGTGLPAPQIILSGALREFGPILQGVVSPEQSYTVSGSDLLGPINIAAPTGFEISTTRGSSYGNNLTLTNVGGLIPLTVVYVRFVPTASGFIFGSITHTSTNAPVQNITAAGRALEPKPTIQASSLAAVEADGTTITLTWRKGNGTQSIVFAKAGAPVDAQPTDATTYFPNPNFGLGIQIGSGNYVVYAGTGNTASVRGLGGNTTYYFAVYEFNGSGGAENYLTDAAATANHTTAAVTYRWSTVRNGSWSEPSNWIPRRAFPTPSDFLQFSEGDPVTVTSVPSQTIAQLSVTGNATVNLETAASNTLTINGGASALSVANGSQLNLSGSNPLTISLSIGSTGVVSGKMTFTSGAHKLIAADSNGVTFQNGSVFTTGAGFSGNPFGSTNLNSIVFASGSTFIFTAGSNPFAASAPSSVVVFQTGSLYSHQASGTPSVSGRTYANFEFNVPGVSTSVTGATALMLDNLTVTDGNLNLNLTGGVNINGNVTVATGKTLTFTPASSSSVTFNGSTSETIGGSGTLTFGPNASVVVNNASGVTLRRNIVINGSLVVNGLFNCGVNTVTGTGSFTLSDGATLAFGSPDGIKASSAAGNVQVTGSRSFSSTGKFICNGSSGQVIGDGLPSSIGDLTIDNAAGVSLTQDATVSGTLFLTNGTLSLGPNTLTLNGGISQLSGNLTGGPTSNIVVSGSGPLLTLPGIVLNNLTVNRLDGVNAGTGITINGVLSLTSGTVTNAGNITLADGAAISRSSGSLSAPPTFGGSVDVIYTAGLTAGNELPTSTTALRDLTLMGGGGSAVILNGNLTVNRSLTLTSGILSIGSNTLELKGSVSGSGTVQSEISGTVGYEQTSDGQNILAANYGNLIFSGFAKTLPSTGIVTVGGTFTPGSASAHVIMGSSMLFNGGGQNIPSFTYNNLTLSGSGTKTAAAGVIVSGALMISGVELADAGNTLVVRGSIVNNGSHSGTGKIQLANGDASHTLSGTGNYRNLEVADARGATLGNDVTVTGGLALSNGVVTTGSNKLIVTSTGVVAAGSASSYVVGTLQKSLGAGSQAFNFALGDGAGFAPVFISAINVSTPGTLTVTTTAAKYPEIISSGIHPSKGLRRYWTFTSGGGLNFRSFDATFSYGSRDIDFGADPKKFIVRRLDGETLETPAISYQTSTSIQVTGGTGTGVFIIGEPATAEAPEAIMFSSDSVQIGKVMTTLGRDLSVRVIDALGNPVQGVPVKFAVQSFPSNAAGQSLSVTNTLTGIDGTASSLLTLGTKVGEYDVAASSVGMRGSPLLFRIKATSGAAARIDLVSGDNQTGLIAAELPQRLIVKLTDEFGNAAAGESVTFAFSNLPEGSSGQSLNPAATTSNDDGLAGTTLTLGNKTGRYVLTASSPNVLNTQVVFTAIATYGPPAKLVPLSGNNQKATVNTAVQDPFIVLLTDSAGNLLSGFPVAFTITSAPSAAKGQTLSVRDAITDTAGRASTVLTLGSRTGTYTVTATSTSLTGVSVIFSAMASGGAETITLTAGNNQVGSVGQDLQDALTVFIADAVGDAVQGVVVRFAIASTPPGATGQKLSAMSATTSSSGLASTVLTLGDREGIYAVTATSEGLAGSPVLFLAIALSVSGVERVDVVPIEFQLYQNYPNPFNPSTEIQFDLKEGGQVRLLVQDLLGRTMDMLVDGAEMMAGRYRIRWDASDKPSGVYFVRLVVEPPGHSSFVSTRKIVLVK